jgi:hypothetical protein
MPPSTRTGDASGRCLCGAIGYRVHGPLRDVIFCHCTRCRRTHGHFAAYTACARDDLELVETRGLRWYELDESRRGFCGECGASVFWEREGSPTISIAAGTLDEPTGLRPSHHVFTANAGDYYELADALERRPGPS